MHIVLSGYFGFRNTGDDAILSAVIQQLRSIDPDIRITVLTNDEIQTLKDHDVSVVNRWKITEVWKTLRKADGLISGGGSLLQDATGIRSVFYYCGVMQIARMLKKPVYVYAQGIGPLSRGISRKVTAHTLNRVSAITVRDTPSRQLLQEIGVRSAISVVPDPVFGFAYTSSCNEGSPILTFSIRNWRYQTPFKEKLAACADAWAAKGFQIVFLPMHGEEDEACASDIRSLMSAEATITAHDASIMEKMEIIGQSELLIGMRLHALIFAAVTETPFLPISYDPKIDAFAGSFAFGKVFQVEDDDWSAEELSEEAYRLWTNRERIRKALQAEKETKLAETRKTAADAWKTIQEHQKTPILKSE